MEKRAEIRRLIEVENRSKRSVCRDFKIHGDTLKKILELPEPPGYWQSTPRRKRKIGPYPAVVDEILRQDRDVHRKHRHPKRRLFERLRDEYGYAGGSTAVKEAVRDWEQRRREVFMEGHRRAFDFPKLRGLWYNCDSQAAPSVGRMADARRRRPAAPG